MTRTYVATIATLLCTARWQMAATSTTLRFDFGNGQPAPGYIKITPITRYTDQLGYGLEPGSAVESVDRGGRDRLKADFLTSEAPFYFSVHLPEEGNYRVTVILGDRRAAATTTVKAELRRLMLANIHTAPGHFQTRTFLVNIRTPRIAGDGEVRLKPREKVYEAVAWDDKLTLEFLGPHPAVCGLTIEKDDQVPTLYIAGDSTSTDQPREPFSGWGQMLPVFFKPSIAVANNGESGESLRSFIAEKRLDKVMSVIRPGDWLFIQMGHNDQKEKGPGVGAFTTYKADLKRFIAEARQHGATPVLITPMNRLTFGPDGKIINSLGDFPEAVRQTAKEEHVALIDLHAMSAKLYEALGQQNAHLAFAGSDHTHTDDYGSYEMAKCIVEGIKANKLPLAKYLYPLPPFDPEHPDEIKSFPIPPDPQHGFTPRPYGE
jgi:lysophospholipase L1-like esterase